MNSTLWGRLARIWRPVKDDFAEWRTPIPPPEDKGELGEAARKLLDDPVLNLAIDRIEEKLVATWKHTAPGERAEREAAYQIYWATQQFRGELRVMIANAGMSSRERARTD